MAIKKAKAHHHNGTGFDTLHYETQPSQVKVMSGDTVLSDLDTLLLKGVAKSGVDMATIKDAGVYRVKNMTGTKPFTMTADVEYPLIVQVSGAVVVQTVVNHSVGDFHSRVIVGSAVKPFFSYGANSMGNINMLDSQIGDMSDLDTATKSTLVGAINELVSDVILLEGRSAVLETKMSQVQTQLNNHNHDATYFKRSGGRVTGVVTISKGNPLKIEDNANLPVDVVSVDESNRVTIGQAENHTVIRSKGGLLQLWDGTAMAKVMTNKNGGHGSKFDADMLDGVEGSKYARKDTSNIFEDELVVSNGKSMYLKAPAGSAQAGSLFFKDSGNVTKARITADVYGDLNLSAGDYDNFKVKASGDTQSYHSHVLLSTNRNVAIRFKDNAVDEGAGMYMNFDGRFGIYDWKRNEEYVFFDRATGRSKFKHALEIQGKRLSIQATAPSSPVNGDVWVQT